VAKLKDRFDRYAILHVWDFQNPSQCTFHVEPHKGSGGGIPAAVEKHIRANFFAPEDFETFIVAAATRGETMKLVLALLRGEPLPGKEAIPYLGQSQVLEEVLAVASRDKIALNVGGTWFCREASESEDVALLRLRQKAWRTGNDLYLIKLGLPNQVGGGGVVVPPPGNGPVVTPPGGTGPTAVVPLGGNGPTVVTPPPVTTPGGQTPVITPPPGTDPPVVPNPVIRKSLGAKSGMNFLGDLEKWGYPDSQKTMQVVLTITDLTVKELRDLCTKLPNKIKPDWQITLPPEGGPAQ
jgi:hypothetical protein